MTRRLTEIAETVRGTSRRRDEERPMPDYLDLVDTHNPRRRG
jgi:hypothetical protein